MSGYDVVKYLHQKFHILPSAGTVYSLLYALERRNFIEGIENQSKRVYKLTQKGEKFLEKINGTKDNINTTFSSIFY
jgi:DNA-binding PadR family transcriptional regulator